MKRECGLNVLAYPHTYGIQHLFSFFGDLVVLDEATERIQRLDMVRLALSTMVSYSINSVARVKIDAMEFYFFLVEYGLMDERVEVNPNGSCPGSENSSCQDDDGVGKSLEDETRLRAFTKELLDKKEKEERNQQKMTSNSERGVDVDVSKSNKRCESSLFLHGIQSSPSLGPSTCKLDATKLSKTSQYSGGASSSMKPFDHKRWTFLAYNKVAGSDEHNRRMVDVWQEANCVGVTVGAITLKFPPPLPYILFNVFCSCRICLKATLILIFSLPFKQTLQGFRTL
ncbi:hypothetical protein VNO78_22398 [Psophocarpus tetragonolobus]|uniref:Uncharacterized protein n=1 Tax=Psophocarpus tetragonolobus TaxID=3891 RepID=A0AAN9XIY8_PSOTE